MWFSIALTDHFVLVFQRNFRRDPVKLSSSRRPLSRFGLAVVSLGDMDLDGLDGQCHWTGRVH